MKYVGVFLLFPSLILGEFNSFSYLIDAPTAYLSHSVFDAGLNFSIASPDAKYPTNYILYTSVTFIDRVQTGLSIFPHNLFSFDIKVKVLKKPTISVGSLYLTPYRYISPVGKGSNISWPDYQYKYGEWRNSEQFSFFAVATEDLGAYGIYSVGIGRGVFVGYGPRSHYFNTDLFVKGHHNNALGLFLGVEYPIISRLSMIFEFDGRDANIGLKFKDNLYQLGISFSKFEHTIFKPKGIYSRIAIGGTLTSVAVKRMMGLPYGRLLVYVVEGRGGKPKSAIVSFPETPLPCYRTSRKSGRCEIKMEPGVYRVRVSKIGYWISERTVYVLPHSTTICHFTISPLHKLLAF
jgi:hypothetical protein